MNIMSMINLKDILFQTWRTMLTMQPCPVACREVMMSTCVAILAVPWRHEWSSRRVVETSTRHSRIAAVWGGLLFSFLTSASEDGRVRCTVRSRSSDTGWHSCGIALWWSLYVLDRIFVELWPSVIDNLWMSGSEIAQVRLLTDGRGHWQHHLLQWSARLMASYG